MNYWVEDLRSAIATRINEHLPQAKVSDWSPLLRDYGGAKQRMAISIGLLDGRLQGDVSNYQPYGQAAWETLTFGIEVEVRNLNDRDRSVAIARYLAADLLNGFKPFLQVDAFRYVSFRYVGKRQEDQAWLSSAMIACQHRLAPFTEVELTPIAQNFNPSFKEGI